MNEIGASYVQKLLRVDASIEIFKVHKHNQARVDQFIGGKLVRPECKSIQGTSTTKGSKMPKLVFASAEGISQIKGWAAIKKIHGSGGVRSTPEWSSKGRRSKSPISRVEELDEAIVITIPRA
ncbi:hypothetical protein V6N12_012820 [Hibiscus sabdariffa]|uniref:Uncharacterized protein n=1 Tax=Hibiscus sabdariffa TaxID=183260 RepID=A0ABR2EFW4_9ROSI